MFWNLFAPMFGGYFLILEALWRILRGHFEGFGEFSKTNSLLGFQLSIKLATFSFDLKTMKDNF